MGCYEMNHQVTTAQSSERYFLRPGVLVVKCGEFGECETMSENELIKIEEIRNRIYTIRGVQVMLDDELAKLYGVETKRLNEQVKRNIERFPAEFMFQPSAAELENLKSQFATLNNGRVSDE